MNQSYKTTLAALKTHGTLYEVIHDGDVYRFDDVLTASDKARELGGRLYRVIEDAEKPNGFYRKKIEPIVMGYAGGRIQCVPVFGL